MPEHRMMPGIDRSGGMRGTVVAVAPNSTHELMWIVETDAARSHLRTLWMLDYQLKAFGDFPPEVGDKIILRFIGEGRQARWEGFPA